MTLWRTPGPLPLWGFFVGALVGVGLGLLIPDVMTAVGGGLLFGLLGALVAWLSTKLVGHERWRG